MLLNTKNFGQIEIDENKILTFEDGLPGFLDCIHYILLTNDDKEQRPIWWLQCTDKGNVAFPVLNTFAVLENYRPEVDDETLALLGEFKNSDELIVCNVLVVPQDINNITVNLKAPIIININTKRGMQIEVRNKEYTVRHNLYQEIEKSKKTEE